MNFNRIAPTIDVEAMQQSHVTLIGGAYGLARDLVHSGLGAVTLVDFDRIDASNPARQDFYSTDMGRYKVEATAEINNTKVVVSAIMERKRAGKSKKWTTIIVRFNKG